MNCRFELLVNQGKRLPDLLLYYRLVWYKQIMTERLLRFKHFIIIIVALIIPTFSVLPGLVASPFIFIALPDPTVSPAWVILTAIFIHAIYVLWVALQKEAIMGGRSMTYLSTFPLPLMARTKTDWKLLLIANHIFWLPVIFSLILILKQEGVASFSPALRWLQLLISLLVAQWLYLHERFFLLILIIATQSGVLILSSQKAQLVSALISLTGITALLVSRQAESGCASFWGRLSSFLKKQHRLRFNLKILSLIKVSYVILLRKYRQESYVRLFFCILALIILYQISTRSSFGIEQTYSIAMAIPLLIASGWYNKLYLEHKQYRSYLASLPIQAKSWVLLDIGVVFSITLSLQTLFFMPFLITHQFPLFKFFQLILAQIPLVAVLYLCQTQLSKLCHVIGTATTGLWLSLFLMYG